MPVIAAIAAAALAGSGCTAAARLGVATGRPATTVAAPGAPPGAPEDVASAPHDPPADQFARQLGDLRGRTLDEARQRLKQLGHDGPVSVAVEDRYAAGCGRDRVCDWRLHGARTIHDEITLWINPRLEIPAPP